MAVVRPRGQVETGSKCIIRITRIKIQACSWLHLIMIWFHIFAHKVSLTRPIWTQKAKVRSFTFKYMIKTRLSIIFILMRLHILAFMHEGKGGDVCNNCLCNNHGLCNINHLHNKKSTAYVITTACVIRN